MLEGDATLLREDCSRSLCGLPDLAKQLTGHRIAVVGGTGFVGSWLAESVAALNDDFGCGLRIVLFGRHVADWGVHRPHLVRDDIAWQAVDVRSPFVLPQDTTLVLYAAGIADPRVHSTDPHRVFQTNVYGIDHALLAAARLERIQRFVNLSSGLVLGTDLPQRPLGEKDLGVLDFTRFHNLYAEARRCAESLACVFAGQYRVPLSTARAFTFLGPYQTIDAPWAINNFIRDALAGQEIRIHGDGGTRRSYLYGSDVAAWLLKVLVDGRDGEAYNIGGSVPVTHGEAAGHVAALTLPTPSLVYKSRPGESGRKHDFYPDVQHSMQALGVRDNVGIGLAIERSMQWHARRLGVTRYLRPASNRR